ncbi:MAG: glycosyltransferase family 2 protein [Thermogutta sp.]
MKVLTALPVYNESVHVEAVLREVKRYVSDILVVDDGSTDGTEEVLNKISQVKVIRHPENRGYGAALRTAFSYAMTEGYEILVTIDCDGQHEPCRIPDFLAACTGDVDIVSGSRYLRRFPGDSEPPPDRKRINRIITEQLNRLLDLRLTDAFCGFKAYRVAAISRLDLTVDGYAMPMELWVQAASKKLKIVELPVPLIYFEEKRAFGGALDNAEIRLGVYRMVLERSLRRAGLPVTDTGQFSWRD